MTPPGVVRVLLVDDQVLVRTGFEMILSVEDDIDVVGSAANGEQALELCRRLAPDVVLMDVQMPVLDGIAATRQVVAEQLSRVVILTTFDRDDYLFDALAAGASGFLLKNAEPERLVDAIRVVASGQALLAPDVTLRVIQRMTAATPTPAVDPGAAVPAAQHGAEAGGRGVAGGAPATGLTAALPPGVQLTAREVDVLHLVAEGMSNLEVARELFVTEATVKTHVSSLLAKLGLRDRVQAVVWAHRMGMVRPLPPSQG